MLVQAGIEQVGGGFVIAMSSALGLRDDVINASQFAQVRGRNAHSFGSEFLLRGIPPHNGGAAFGRDHGIDRVLHHQDAVRHSDRQRSSTSTYSNDRSDDGYFQPRHLAQIVGDRLRLTALFGLYTRVGAVSVDQRKNRTPKLLRNLHHADRLAVSLGVRRSKITEDPLFHVAALLRAYDQNFFTVESGHAADNRRIVPKAAVSMNFAEIGEYPLDVIECLRTLRMPRQFGLLPGIGRRVHLPAEVIDTSLQLLDFAACGLAGTV